MLGHRVGDTLTVYVAGGTVNVVILRAERSQPCRSLAEDGGEAGGNDGGTGLAGRASSH
jgi:hypothetical protein